MGEGRGEASDWLLLIFLLNNTCKWHMAGMSLMNSLIID